jgi:hypothetical protein
MYGILAAVFVTMAFFGMESRRFQVVFGLAALVLAPVVLGIVSGPDGLVYSLVGASVALFLTLPLSVFGYVCREDVVVSIALGGILGAVHYAAVFCVAAALLAIQRMLKTGYRRAAVEAAGAAGPRGSRLLAFDEQSALVEIEMLKMLRKDEGDSPAPEPAEERTTDEPGSEPAARGDNLPWCAKLAIATLAILMIGSSI